MNIIDEKVAALVTRYPVLDSSRSTMSSAATLLVEQLQQSKKILICGNGGSAADADHIVGELMKSFVKDRPIDDALRQRIISVDKEEGPGIAANLQKGIPAIALTQHTSLSTAYANDVEPALVFAQQTMVLGSPGDIFWGISTSGNSANVLYAAITAKACGLKVLGMTGESGGKLRRYCDICITVPETETYRIQELHLPIYHQLCLILEEVLC